jgi:glycosyltransferase involved in cell wall biosynthesis
MLQYPFITAIILTFNEENVISKCLNSLNFVDEIIILDSFSTDKTINIASDYNVKIFQYKFDNFSNQRNRALKLVDSSCSWVLMLDADEIISNELRYEIINVTNLKNNDISLYNIKRKDFYNNKWIKYSSGYPTWFGRLFKNGHVWVEREINEEYHTNGKIGFLNEHILHYPFNKGISWWVIKHNNYSTSEASLLSNTVSKNFIFFHLFNSNPVIRRRNQKILFYNLPFRPFLIFIFLYFFRLGFLDGNLGFRISFLRSFYEWLIIIKLEEKNYFINKI